LILLRLLVLTVIARPRRGRGNSDCHHIIREYFVVSLLAMTDVAFIF
jgi:hypothetical protein